MSPRLVRAVAVAAGAAVILVVGAQGMARVQHIREEVTRLEREIGALRAETHALATAASRLRTSPEAIEEAAREFGMVRPGERVYKLPPSHEGR